jgi:hypothetical protein
VSALSRLGRGAVMLAVASMLALITDSAMATSPHDPPASSVASPTAISSAGWESSTPGRALSTEVARGVTYGGSTSANDPIVVMLSRDGKSVRRITTRFEATCTDGAGFVMFVDGATNRTIDPSGRFVGMFNVTDDLGSGVTRRRTSSLKGKVEGKKVTGSFRFHVDHVDAASAVVATCDQTATFHAIAARGRVFGGRTSQHAPVVVELAAKRKVVRRFRIGWQSSCTPSETSLHVGETLMNFPLASGRFGDDFTENLSGPTGEKQTSRYSLRGRLGGPRSAARCA